MYYAVSVCNYDYDQWIYSLPHTTICPRPSSSSPLSLHVRFSAFLATQSRRGCHGLPAPGPWPGLHSTSTLRTRVTCTLINASLCLAPITYIALLQSKLTARSQNIITMDSSSIINDTTYLSVCVRWQLASSNCPLTSSVVSYLFPEGGETTRRAIARWNSPAPAPAPHFYARARMRICMRICVCWWGLSRSKRPP